MFVPSGRRPGKARAFGQPVGAPVGVVRRRGDLVAEAPTVIRAAGPSRCAAW